MASALAPERASVCGSSSWERGGCSQATTALLRGVPTTAERVEVARRSLPPAWQVCVFDVFAPSGVMPVKGSLTNWTGADARPEPTAPAATGAAASTASVQATRTSVTRIN